MNQLVLLIYPTVKYGRFATDCFSTVLIQPPDKKIILYILCLLLLYFVYSTRTLILCVGNKKPLITQHYLIGYRVFRFFYDTMKRCKNELEFSFIAKQNMV